MRDPVPGVPVLSSTSPDPASGAPAAVIVDDVSMRFDDQLAVDSISIALPAGTILGVIGA
jgi:hypothetical protein